ncbi:MAG: ATP-binding protein [Actinomycetota bacterium]
MGSLAVAFHFVATFVVTAAAVGAAFTAVFRRELVRTRRSLGIVFGLGCLLLAGGEFLHGAEILSNPSGLTAGLRAMAYLLIVGALGGSFWGDAPPTSPRDASSSLPGSRNKVAGLMTLVAALGLFVVTEALFYLITNLHSGPPSPAWFLVHAGRLAAGLILLAWLWQVLHGSIQARLVTLFIVLLLTVVVSISGAMTQFFASNISTEALRRAGQEATVEQRLIASQIEESVSRARQVAELDSVRQAVAKRDPVLAGTVNRLQSPGGPFDTSDFMAFFDPAGTLLALSATGPNKVSNLAPADALSLAGTRVVQSALDQRQAGSVDALGARKLGLVGAFPIFNPVGFDSPGSPRGLAGAVALGRVIDRRYLLGVAREAGQGAFLINRTGVLLGTIPGGRGVILRSRADKERVFDQGRLLALQEPIGGDEFFSSYIPLQQPDGKVVGAIVLVRRSTVLQATRQSTIRTVFFLALVATVIGGALAYVFGARITRPILELTRAAEKIRAGDLAARIRSEGTDEVGVLSDTFDEMAESLGDLTTELRSAVETQSGLRGRLETILQSITDGIVATDPGGKILAFNREAERITQVRTDDAMGTDIRQILRVADSSGSPLGLPIYDLMAGAVRGFAGGEDLTPVAVTSAAIEDESGNVLGAVAVLRDLTSEFEIDKMKNSFLSNVSHELRTPLTPIKGYADILKRKDVPRAKALTFLDGILDSAERLERIVDMLVDFSAMEAGKLLPRKGPVDLKKATAQLVGKWASQSPGHNFEQKGFTRLPVLELDQKLVPLAVGELVDNAVKFSPKGGRIVIKAELAQLRSKAGDLRLSVKDEGIGIAPEELALISGNFAQLDDSVTRAYGGLGLGLAYIKRIVELHNGRLEVRSAPGKGSEFTLVFPGIALHKKP